MRCRQLSSLSVLLLVAACKPIMFADGTPCGGNRMVRAEAALPDTGIGAGGLARIDFLESESISSLDESSLFIWTFPPPNTSFADSPPRVRVTTADGRVFLDREAGPAYQGSWYLKAFIPKGQLRDEIVAAFQDGVVTVEFSTAQPSMRVTRVQPIVSFAGRNPVLQCV